MISRADSEERPPTTTGAQPSPGVLAILKARKAKAEPYDGDDVVRRLLAQDRPAEAHLNGAREIDTATPERLRELLRMFLDPAKGPGLLTLMMQGENGIDDVWRDAAKHFEEGERASLAQLLRSGMPLPKYARELVSDVVAGRFKFREQRGRHRRQLPEEDQRLVILELNILRTQRNILLIDLDRHAEQSRVEPSELRRKIDLEYQSKVAALAKSYGISKRRLEDLAKPSAR